MAILLVKIIFICIVVYCFIVIFAFFFQEKMMYFPSGTFGKCPEAEKTGVVPVREDGTRFYLRKTQNASFWMIFFHGNAGCACDRMYFMDMFGDLPANLAVFEYPGYGGDTRKPGESIILQEALNLVRYIRKEYSDSLPVYLAGESLGTGVVTWLAGETDVNGLILISPYTSIADVAAAHYPILPVRLLSRNRFPADVWAANVDIPVLAFHGKDDTVIPIRFAREQISSFKKDADLFEIENTGHNDILLSGRELIRSEVGKFTGSSGDSRLIPFNP